ncbi:MAG: DNA-directed RNA polymerase subunit H [Thermoplasmata archaeon]|nr:MAG: DNA-directed RNA polymerase subunit H [Thermoplasmata archaeon]
MAKIDIMNHSFVPKHTILTDEEANSIMKEFNITRAQLPKIYVTDPVIKIIKGEVGNIIKIERKSPTAEVSYAYRVVVDTR